MMHTVLVVLLMLAVASVVYWVISQFTLPPPVKAVVLGVLAILLLIWIAGLLGVAVS